MNPILDALVRRLAKPFYGEQQQIAFASTPAGEQACVQSLPERTEVSRFGSSFGAAIPTASAFTFVAAWPTTRAELVLWNGELATGKSYVIDRVWLTNITSMAASQPMSLLAQIAPASLNIAAPTNNAAVLSHPLGTGSTATPSLARLMVANTAFAVANQWVGLASQTPAPTTNLGVTIEKELYGRYIITPGSAFCLAGIAGTAAGTAIAGIEWHEIQLAIGNGN